MDKNLFSFENRKSATQLFRYTIIGLMSNFIGYMIYLLITYFGATPKITMTVLYGIGATVSFFLNSKLTFEHTGSLFGPGVRYIIAHCFGYLINFILLFILVDKLGYAHQWIQAMAIFVVAVFLFLMFKFFVFSPVKVLDSDS